MYYEILAFLYVFLHFLSSTNEDWEGHRNACCPSICCTVAPYLVGLNHSRRFSPSELVFGTSMYIVCG